MLDSADTILQSHGHEGKPHLHINKLDGEHGAPKDKAREAHDVELVLRERLKELNCLYGISRLVDQHGDDLDLILQGIVDSLPSAWQYAEICCARMSLFDKLYTSGRFCDSANRQSAEIHVAGQPSGRVTVCYSKKMTVREEGAFLKEERDLINEVAERTGRIVEQFQIKRQLELDRATLQESNAAFRRVLAQIDEEKREIHDSITANVDQILMPALRALEGEIPAQQKKYVALLRKRLDNLVSPFANRLYKAFSKLTPVEIEICDLIRDGFSTKEVAQVRHVTPKTVEKQRERIRKKLQIEDASVNLAAYLRAFSSGAS